MPVVLARGIRDISIQNISSYAALHRHSIAPRVDIDLGE
jgi:hypothetical protein